MGNKKEAVRVILAVMPEWPDDNHKSVRLDADGEVVLCRYDCVDATATHSTDFTPVGYCNLENRAELPAYPHKKAKDRPAWFVPWPDRYESASHGLVGAPITRMEYEVFRAAILGEEKT